MTTAFGKALYRTDGVAKVTGNARYGADLAFPGMVYASFVCSGISAGAVTGIDTAPARRLPGVIAVFTHENMPRLQPVDAYVSAGNPKKSSALQTHMPMQDDRILYDQQFVAMAVAESLEAAQAAAKLIRVSYAPSTPSVWNPNEPDASVAPEKLFGAAEAAYQRGDVDAQLKRSEDTGIVLKRRYVTATNHHNPMEPHSTTAVWKGDALTVYSSSQWVVGMQHCVAQALGIPEDKVRVVSEYAGGAFGCKAAVPPHVMLTAAVALELRRPVRAVLTRTQMWGATGFRQATVTDVKVGADRTGRLQVIEALGRSETPPFRDICYEPSVLALRSIYACPALRTDIRLARTNTSSPVPMRSPGEASSLFVIESAMNELAVELGMDPLELRRLNHADRDPVSGLPWSSKSLLACYAQGAELFGWHRRTPAVGSMKRNGKLIGWGVGTASYTVLKGVATVRIRAFSNGRFEVATASHEIGTGTYTIVAQLAAEALSVAADRIDVRLGDTQLPPSGASVGAMTAVTLAAAVKAAAQSLQGKLDELRGGRSGESLRDTVSRSGQGYVEAVAQNTKPSEEAAYALASFGANFAEVEVDPVTRWARVSRVVGVYDCGNVINPRTARSQLLGGCVFALGMAHMEESLRDDRTGRWVNADFGSYHIPVQADMPAIELRFVQREDPQTPYGMKTVGELGGIGLSAAITGALHHATGKWVRELPYKPESLL